MGTTINGVYVGGKSARRQRALERLNKSIKGLETVIKTNSSHGKDGELKADPKELEKLRKGIEKKKAEAAILTDRLSGIKKEII